MPKRSFDTSIVVTFHREGILAQQTLRSISKMRTEYENSGQTAELICVCDRPDRETKRIVENFHSLRSDDQVVEYDFGDPGASRNAGAQLSNASFLTILDGDDLYSSNWLTEAVNQARDERQTIVHPEMVVSFGDIHAYSWQIDQKGSFYEQEGLLVANYWAQWFLGPSEVLSEIPYPEYSRRDEQFAYEDWWWNCETIAHGYSHRLAWGTVGFYRRKSVGRLNGDSSAPMTFSKTTLFM